MKCVDGLNGAIRLVGAVGLVSAFEMAVAEDRIYEVEFHNMEIYLTLPTQNFRNLAINVFLFCVSNECITINWLHFAFQAMKWSIILYQTKNDFNIEIPDTLLMWSNKSQPPLMYCLWSIQKEME